MQAWANPGGTSEDHRYRDPLNKKRMETTDEEIKAEALDFIERQYKAGAHQLDLPAAVPVIYDEDPHLFFCGLGLRQ
jgi:hypothetical protein